MNTQEITINKISSLDITEALMNMDEHDDILALLFSLMSEYKDSPDAKLLSDWFRGLITLDELIHEIFKFLEPNIPLSVDMVELDFTKVDTIEIQSRRASLAITMTGALHHRSFLLEQ